MINQGGKGARTPENLFVKVVMAVPNKWISLSN